MACSAREAGGTRDRGEGARGVATLAILVAGAVTAQDIDRLLQDLAVRSGRTVLDVGWGGEL